MENGTTNSVNSFYRHLQSTIFERRPTGTNSASQHLRLKPLVKPSIVSTTQWGKVDMNEVDYLPNSSQATSTNSLEKVKPTFPVEAKGVSRNLMKAIVKPTVSHIADAYNKFEV